MKFVKKLFLVLIMAFALVGIVACGSDDDTSKIEDLVKEEIVVNFDTQGGSAIQKMTIKVSEAANFNLPADPTKDGYAFVGWYLDASYKNEFKNLEAKSGEITLYAKWETVSANSIVVKFETNGGTPLNNVVVNVLNPDASLLSNVPTKAGEVFLGWYLDPSLSKVATVDAIIAALASKEVTLYAKWVKEGEAISGAIKVVAQLAAELDADVTTVHHSYDGHYDETGQWVDEERKVVSNSKVEGRANVKVECAVSATSLEKFEDLGIALLLSAEIATSETVDGKSESDDWSLPKTEISLYLADGCLYVVIPAALIEAEADLAVKVDLVKIYNDNIATVKEYLKQLVEMLKSLPAEDLPEGFDLSVLDRIDIDNLKIEDLLGLVDLLPEQYKEMINNPEEVTIAGALELLEQDLGEFLPEELDEETLELIEKLVTDIAEILKGFLPTKTVNGDTTKYEITDKQVEDTVDALAAYVKENINDIFGVVMLISSMMSDSDSEDDYGYEGEDGYSDGDVVGEEPGEGDPVGEGDPEGDDEPYVIDMSEYINPMIDQYVALLKKVVSIDSAYVTVKSNGLFPTEVYGLLEASAKYDGEDLEPLGAEPEEAGDIRVKVELMVKTEVLASGITFPDFTSFMDMTDTINAVVASALADVFGGSEDIEDYPAGE